MINLLKSKWRKAHISKDDLKLGPHLRFNKKKFKIYNTRNAIPNLIIVGSQKCGTSSLHYYLSEHPDIYMSSSLKESGYFIFNEWAKDYWREKGQYFKTKNVLKQNGMITDAFINQKYFGDSSTHYTIGNRVEHFDIAKIIKNESPNAKIIYLIRNPFERITSSYYHMKKYWGYNKSIDDFIEDHYSSIETTLFYNQIEPFLKVFGTDVLLLQFEDLISDTQSTLSKIYLFLQLDDIQHSNFEIHNKTSPKETEKFSIISYNKLFPLFLEQKQLLESQLGTKTTWDLNESSWTKNDIIL